MIVLLLVLSLLLGINAWLIEPLLQGLTAVLEQPILPWLALGVAAWLLAGGQRQP